MMKERTNNQSVAPHKVKGTVLFTVVCVMMVLIVFLMGALALAATANNRAMNTYSTAQTQATAKAGVEAIISAMRNDKTVATAALGIRNEAGSQRVNIGEITFGYMDDVTDDEGTTTREAVNIGALGRITESYMEYAGSKWVVEGDELVEKTIIKISATAEQGTATSTYTAYIMRGVEDDSKNGESQGFIATGSATSGNHTSVYGGAYIGFDQKWKDEVLWEASLPNTSITYIANDAASVYETDYMINGNFTNDSGSDLHLVIKGPGTGMTVWGNMELTHPIYLESVNALSSNFTDATKAINYKDIPYLYVEGDITMNSAGSEKIIAPKNLSTKIPFHIYCGSIQETKENGSTKIMGDVFCYDEAKTSKLTQENNSKLYEWGNVQVTNSDGLTAKNIGGSFYTKGSLEVNGTLTIDGDLVVERELKVSGGTLTVTGNVMVGQTLTLGGNLTVGKTLTCPAGQDTSKVATGHIDASADPSGALKPGYTKTDVTETKTRVIPEKTYAKAIISPDNTVLAFVESQYDWGGYGYNDGDTIQLSVDGKFLPDPSNPGWTLDSPVVPAGSVMRFNYTVPEHEETYNETRTVYKNASGAEVPASEATESSGYFPKEYEKDVILGKKNIDGSAGSDGKIIKTVPEILKSSFDPYATYYEVPDTTSSTGSLTHKQLCENNVLTSGADTKAGAWIKDGGNRYIITGDCTIKGGFGVTQFIVRAPKATDHPEGIWIVLDNVNIDNRGFVIDDSVNDGIVNFLVKGHCKFNATPGMDGMVMENGDAFSWQQFGYLAAYSVASKLNDNTQAHQIYTDANYAIAGVDVVKPASVYIYSEKTGNPKISISNNTCMTAMVKAPYMDFDQTSTGGFEKQCTLYYNGFDIAKVPQTHVGNVGCLICQNFEAGNNWTLLFTGAAGGPKPPDIDDALFNNWSIMHYDNY